MRLKTDDQLVERAQVLGHGLFDVHLDLVKAACNFDTFVERGTVMEHSMLSSYLHGTHCRRILV